ncbi:YycH family regulatory protein [Paenibacillus sp. P96]|uniref:YycH family regulatory protein n=1 Tax=Paenibacillus zeirhizosphaerae TaxID=2987519 RepID=A0ABT9FNW5_9BACL|nr:two-component system activity regulator YycH [Paenibacillus sp. P96]MDP4096426.1 YycH family regulatory protein [Paenibacillus sp. P96]
MKERVKSMALSVLVLGSLVQSYFLIYRLPGSGTILSSETSYVQTDNMGQEESIEDLIFPDRMIIHMGEDKHTVFYPGTTFYDLILSRLEGRTFESYQRRSIQSSDWNAIRKENKGIELSFSGGVPVTLLERLMRITPDPVFRAETINRIWIYVDKQASQAHALFFSTRGDVVYEATQADLTIEDVEQHVAFGTSTTPYELTDGAYYIPYEGVEAEQPVILSGLFTTEQMQRNLFFDPGITRNIQEKDGSEIYTDSKRSLQVRQEQRWMSYTDPAAPSSEESDAVRDLLAGVEFVNQHGGWDGSYRLAMQSSLDYGTQVLFQQYYKSYPVMDKPSFRFGTIQLEMQQETASVYERSLLYLKGGEHSSTKVMLPGGEKLKQQLAKQTEGRAITDISPAYLPKLKDQGIELVPVWRVKLESGGEFTVGASSAPPSNGG